jgi:hypothetical protein
LSFDGGKECPNCANLKRYHIESGCDEIIHKNRENPLKLYSVIKKYSDEIVKLFPEFKILERVHTGYVEAVQGIMAEYKHMKEKNENYETMMNSTN